ncbi:hypothetical protein KJ853_01025 [Patescibacteria group bacterium]|nr:hypothetical protein [Patescibacteria group bacterium]
MLEYLKNIFIPTAENGFLPKNLQNKPLFLYAVGLIALKIALISAFLFLPRTQLFSDIASNELLNLINQARQEKNLPLLALNNQLNSAAKLKADDMVVNNYFDHTSSSGVTPWYWFRTAGYNYDYAGENLAMNFFESRAVFSAWMASPAHRDNILDPNFKEIGLAVKNGKIEKQETTLAVLTFGRQPAPKTSQLAITKPSASPVSSPAQTPALTPAPTAAPNTAGTPSPVAPATKETTSPSAMPEFNSTPNTKLSVNELTDNHPQINKPATKILGAFVSNFEEATKSLYLYFTLFLLIALGINIFVKIRIQRWPAIFVTTALIGLSALLIFI